MQKLFTTLTIASMAFAANVALAQPSTDTGPTVGNAVLTINATGLVNAATGLDASSTQNVGSIESGNVSNVEATVNAAEAMNAATGQGTCADQAIGSIGHKTACQRNK